jgi:hypothetical protein
MSMDPEETGTFIVIVSTARAFLSELHLKGEENTCHLWNHPEEELNWMQVQGCMVWSEVNNGCVILS